MPAEMKQLRQTILAQRRQLPTPAVKQFSQKICHTFLNSSYYSQAKRIACYLAVNNEVDTQLIIQQAWHEHREIYLPVIHHDVLEFARLQPQTKLKLNRFKIAEPDYHASDLITTQDLDLVITPLVAFDENCNRLGMGKGFYDRSFAFLTQAQHTKPLLIGLAYEIQKVTHLHPKPWDVKLHAILTETGCYTL